MLLAILVIKTYYRPITTPVFVQPDLSQGYYYPDSDETSATSLRLTRQPTSLPARAPLKTPAWEANSLQDETG